MDHSDAPASHFGAPSGYSTPHVHQDMQNGPPPPPHWHVQSYAAAVSAPAQTPIGNTHYSAQGYHGHDGCGPDGPVNADDQYQFSPHPVTTTTHAAPIKPPSFILSTMWTMNTGLIPRSLTSMPSLLSQKPKKNNKGKGKARDTSPSLESDADDACSKARNGRSGVWNYNKADKEMLFSIVQQLLLTREKGWKVAESSYNEMVCKAGRPERAFLSLKAKYSLYTKQKKPTGEGENPPDVRRAHQIKDLINDKAGTWDVDDDSELEDDDSNDSDMLKVVEPPTSSSTSHVAVNTLVHSLDPAALRACDDARTHHSFGRIQFMTYLPSWMDFGAKSLLCSKRTTTSNASGIVLRWSEPGLHALTKSWPAGNLMISVGGRAVPRTCTVMVGAEVARHLQSTMAYNIKYLEGGDMMVWETDMLSNATDFDYRVKKKQCQYWSPTPYQHHILNHHCTPSPSPPHCLATVNHCRTPTLSPPRHCAISHCRTPTPGPSRLSFTSTSPTSATLVSGNAVELVVTPRCGSAPLGFIISPNV
ncbi:hypothetical protein DFH08DRAFT_796885 [Mycena albidolilacea]|uniref:DUF6818 domain-containing protein n=1 Tax=Mycena albidolilacea TaxID=1033008 RepID=A0AAD7AW34_9AGAR|nr:hypothetical protein DFH08DRAFT_796885 [Mycena albidolilacea]